LAKFTPTVTHDDDDAHDTPAMVLSPPGGWPWKWGGSFDHLVPSQLSAKPPYPMDQEFPRAKQAFADAHETARKLLSDE
jgi:hypothetical protein